MRNSNNEKNRAECRKIFVALRNLADWDGGRAYYPHGSGAWADGKWIKSQLPTALVEPVVSYWEAFQDPEALEFAKAAEVGAKTEGSAEASTPAVLTEIAGLIASGAVDFDVAATYPLDRVADAFEELEQRHTHGKIVLLPNGSP